MKTEAKDLNSAEGALGAEAETFSSKAFAGLEWGEQKRNVHAQYCDVCVVLHSGEHCFTCSRMQPDQSARDPSTRT